MTAPASRLQPFHAMEVLARAQALEAAGRDICHLEIGEPAAPPAPEVRAAVAAAVPAPQRYTHAKGLPALRAALAAHYADDYGVRVDPGRILVTMGSSAAFILGFLAAFPAGARIAVTRPGYPAYLNILDALGFSAVELPLSPRNGWRLIPEAVTAAHAETPFDGLLFASPANPTGAAATPEDMAGIVAACAAAGVRLVSDEIYHGLEYGPRAPGALQSGDAALVVGSFSKFHCMTGYRVGWLVVPEDLARRAEMLQQSLFISAPSLSQTAAVAALGPAARAWGEAQKAVYARNREVLTAGLQRLGLASARPADGAFYAYVDVSPFAPDSTAFCLDLLERAGVAATPGIDFDRVEGRRYVRFSYAGSPATVDEALARMERFLGAGG